LCAFKNFVVILVMSSNMLKAIQVYVREEWNVVKGLQAQLQTKLYLYAEDTDIRGTVDRCLGATALLEDARQALLVDRKQAILMCAPSLLAAICLHVETLQWTVRACENESRATFVLMCNRSAICLQRTTVFRLRLHAELARDAELVRLWRIAGEYLKSICLDADWTITFIEPEFAPKPAELDKVEKRLSQRFNSEICVEREENLKASVTWWRRSWAINHVYEAAGICDGNWATSHYINMLQYSADAAASFSAAEASLSHAEATSFPCVKRLFQACAAAHVVEAEEHVALYFLQSSSESEETTAGGGLSASSAEEFAKGLEKRLRWRDGLMVALPFVSDHRAALLALVEAGVTKHVTTADHVVRLLASRTEVSDEVRQSLKFHCKLLPGAEHFHLAQHYTDQHAAALKLQHDSEYHCKVAEYWGAACAAMAEYLTPATDSQTEQTSFPVASDAQKHLDRAANFARCATGMLQDAVDCHIQAERTCNEGAVDGDASVWLKDAVQAWVAAARGFMAAAADCCDEGQVISYYDPHHNNRRWRYPTGADNERAALQSVRYAEQLQRKVASLAPLPAGGTIQLVLERNCMLQEMAAYKPGVSLTVKALHQKCLELLRQLCVNGEGSTARDFIWVAEKAVEYSSMLLQMAKRSEGGHVNAAFDRLSGLLEGYAQDCEVFDDDCPALAITSTDKLQMRALTDAAAAHLQGHGVRCDLLLYAAELVDLSYDTFEESERALVHVAERLVQRAAGCNAAAEQEVTSSFPPAAVLAIDALIKAVVDRAETAEIARVSPTARESTTRCAAYTLVDRSFALLIERLHVLLDKRLWSQEEPHLEEEVQVAQQSVDRYLLAVRALEQGHGEASKYWRRAARYGAKVEGAGDTISTAEYNGRLADAVLRSVRAAEALSRGSEAGVEARAWSRASDYAVLLLRLTDDDDLCSKRADKLRDMVICWTRTAQAYAEGRDSVAKLWEAKRGWLLAVHAFQQKQADDAENEEDDDDDDGYGGYRRSFFNRYQCYVPDYDEDELDYSGTETWYGKKARGYSSGTGVGSSRDAQVRDLQRSDAVVVCEEAGECWSYAAFIEAQRMVASLDTQIAQAEEGKG
jgi:hypothetical protein